MNAAENDPASSDGRFNDSGGSVWVLADNFTPTGKLRTALPILIESWPFRGGDLDHRLARSMLRTHFRSPLSDPDHRGYSLGQAGFHFSQGSRKGIAHPSSG